MTRLATATMILATTVCTATATDLTTGERNALHAEIRAYLLANPEVILEAVEIYSERQATAQANSDHELVTANAKELFNDGFSWVGGNPEGDITLVEFLDYRCGYCRRAKPEVMEFLERDGNIRLIVKEFPILGQDSLTLAKFAVATKLVAGPQAYGLVHDTLMEFSGNPTNVALKRIAESLDLDAERIVAQMDSEAVAAKLRATRELAERLDINGTPTFVLAGELLRGYLPADQMMAIAQRKRQDG